MARRSLIRGGGGTTGAPETPRTTGTEEIMQLLDQIISRYKPGGEFGKPEEALLKREKTKSLAGTAQRLVSAGLAGTTAGAGAGRLWEEEVGMPARLRLEDVRSQRLTEAMGAKAGYLERGESAAAERRAAEDRMVLQAALAGQDAGIDPGAGIGPGVGITGPGAGIGGIQPTTGDRGGPSPFGGGGASFPMAGWGAESITEESTIPSSTAEAVGQIGAGGAVGAGGGLVYVVSAPGGGTQEMSKSEYFAQLQGPNPRGMISKHYR